MAKWLDLMLCIFPFEADLYERSGLRTIFVGHPMVVNLGAKRSEAPRDPNLIGLFPGSRMREVRKLMPILMELMRDMHVGRPNFHFEIAAASEALADVIRQEIAAFGRTSAKVEVVVGRASEIMQRSVAGVVASGTATLEAAFFRMPFVLIYKVSGMTYLAGRLLIRVKHLGMPNVLAGREIVPEFIQGKARSRPIMRELLRLLEDEECRAQMLADFDKVIDKLGQGGADDAAARAILDAVESG
jgi:lipid-A-disaccharide synthase